MTLLLNSKCTLTANDELSFSLTCTQQQKEEEEEEAAVDLNDSNQGYTFSKEKISKLQ